MDFILNEQLHLQNDYFNKIFEIVHNYYFQ